MQSVGPLDPFIQKTLVFSHVCGAVLSHARRGWCCDLMDWVEWGVWFMYFSSQTRMWYMNRWNEWIERRQQRKRLERFFFLWEICECKAGRHGKIHFFFLIFSVLFRSRFWLWRTGSHTCLQTDRGGEEVEDHFKSETSFFLIEYYWKKGWGEVNFIGVLLSHYHKS